uniref:Uncharacterized protein n=1 Tax=Arundo donax TaxID=35708 RepID=A0A0A8YGW2_ARUDO
MHTSGVTELKLKRKRGKDLLMQHGNSKQIKGPNICFSKWVICQTSTRLSKMMLRCLWSKGVHSSWGL